MNKLFYVKTATYHFFIIVCLFLQSKTSGCEDVAWPWHKRSEGKNKINPKRCNYSFSARFSNVVFKNIWIIVRKVMKS